MRATDACLSPVCLVDIQQLCGRLMPQVCLLLVDKSADVRELALTVLISCTEVVKSYHKDNKKNSTSGEETVSSAHAISTTSVTQQSNSSAGWTSWTVDGLSKSIEKVALNATSGQVNQVNQISAATPARNEVSVKKDEWGDLDIDFGDEMESGAPLETSKLQKQWGDIPSVSSKSKPEKPKSAHSHFDDWDDMPSRNTTTAKLSKAKEKSTPPPITKMETPTHSDFDDWDDSGDKDATPLKNTNLGDEFDDWGDDLDNIDLPPGETWGDEDDLDLDMNVLGNVSSSQTEYPSRVTAETKPINTPSMSSMSAPTTKPSKVSTAPKKDKEVPKKSTSKAAVVVKKLAVTPSEPDTWDDF